MKKHITLTIDCTQTPTAPRVHAHIAHALHFPRHYGANLDALRDCLTDILIEHSLSVVWRDTEHSKNDASLRALQNVLIATVGTRAVEVM